MYWCSKSTKQVLYKLFFICKCTCLKNMFSLTCTTYLCCLNACVCISYEQRIVRVYWYCTTGTLRWCRCWSADSIAQAERWRTATNTCHWWIIFLVIKIPRASASTWKKPIYRCCKMTRTQQTQWYNVCAYVTLLMVHHLHFATSMHQIFHLKAGICASGLFAAVSYWNKLYLPLTRVAVIHPTKIHISNYISH